ncbi:MAG: alanine:cation symporter family protein [Planctomycetaceae bacterium]|nr:alanine:cation symporter family protein [Planctomycetales bacterium]MCB9925499.1 alanine:cation symporter family protein [Planctomycetaceae bacterium]
MRSNRYNSTFIVVVVCLLVSVWSTQLFAQTAGESANATSWMGKVDSVFGEYLVKPLAAFLFFDFWTGPRTDDLGNVTSEGWLGTSVPFVVIWLLLGATYFTVRMGFINVRAFWHAIRLTKGDYDNPDEPGEVSHFQALSSALSATVGLGNIAGVAIAIGTGGPGACFWMILVGVLGMTSKFTECTLGQMYRKVAPDGTVSGGAMHYLRDGLAELGLKPLGSVLAVIFSLLCVGASFGGGNAFQVGQSLDAIRQDVSLIDTYPWIYGLLMAALAGFVIIGGIKSIGAVASKIVPFMCGAYVLMAMFILIRNAGAIPSAISAIFEGAFSMQAGLGGVLGIMVIGIQRAVFSNEAGVGSAAIAHSAAKTDEPVSEGIVALLEPFIDTVIICTMTALVIILTDAPNEFPQFVTGEQKSGAALTAAAVSGAHGVHWFKYVLYLAVVLFAYSTLISWSYYGERCWTSLFGPRSSMAYKVIFLGFTVLGSIVTTGNILDFSDLLILGMSLPNILGLILLSGKVRSRLDQYWDKYTRGELDPPAKS